MVMEILIAILLLFCLPIIVLAGVAYGMLIVAILLLLTLRNHPTAAYALLFVIGGLGIWDIAERINKTGDYAPKPPVDSTDLY